VTDRLLDRLEPDSLDSAARLIGWMAGIALGLIAATAALVLLLVSVHVG
jgi:hypothetical protein